MSLSGTLGEFALAELLQMAALTGRSGVLEIDAPEGGVWVGFRHGMVTRVALSDGSLDRKRILTAAGLDTDGEGEEVDQPLQSAAVDSLLEVMTWAEGSFRFKLADPEAPDVEVAWSGPDGIELPCAVSPQYLALEGARLGDEGSRDPIAVEALPGAPNTPVLAPGTLIVIDRDLSLLEAIKEGLADTSIQIHIFQSADDGFIRFKQYLLRGEVPTLVLGEGVCDPVEPHRRPGPAALARRVRSLAPAVGVVHLSWKEGPPSGPIDVAIAPPDRRRPREESMPDFLERFRQLLGLGAQSAPPDA